MRTRLTELLDIEHPVMLAGMGGVSYSALVAAVSEAGGFGCFGASTMSGDEMVAEIRAAKALTDKPLGVDLLTAMPDRLMTDVEALIREGASVFAAGLGVPRDVITLCHEHNVLVLSMCGKVRHAIAAVEAGCDIVVAQGTEAGGHTGQVATLPLVPQVVDAVGDRVPVVAAGGIFDGRGIAAALMLGAVGVNLGTRFLASKEAPISEEWKQAILRAQSEQAAKVEVLNDISPVPGTVGYGTVLRSLPTPFLEEWSAKRGEASRERDRLRQHLVSTHQAGRQHDTLLTAGQTADLVVYLRTLSGKPPWSEVEREVKRIEGEAR